tara:strand:- start:5363 stop:5905 length:543 start_codon:yes stop_codon:yes gene_type:complete
MSGIPVAYEVNIDDLRDPELVDVEFIAEAQPISGEISRKIKEAYNLSKTIKMITYSSAVLSLILCTFNIYFLIPLLVTTVGWCGADQYSKSLSIIYIMYLFLVTAVRDYVFMTVFLNYEPSQRGDLYFEMFVVCLSSLINLWLITRVLKFINVIDQLDYTTLDRLYRGQIGNIRRVAIYE